MAALRRSIKCVLVGDGAVGKTSLLNVFVTGKFPVDYEPTILENSSVPLTVDSEAVNLNVWDTSGQEGYEQLRNASYPGTQVFLICFAINSRNSFQNVDYWLAEVRGGDNTTVPVVLVATKTDLRDDATALADLRSRGEAPVSRAEGERLAAQIGASSSYAECSARQMLGVTEVFHQAVRAHCGTATVGKKKRRRRCHLL